MSKPLLVAATALLTTILNASALVTITVDENGHGDWNGAPLFPAGGLANDIGPGGKPNALTYYLGNAVPPFGQTIGSLVPGDLFILETPGGPLSDLIRFRTGNPTLFAPASFVFYSDNSDGVDSLADIGFPTAFNPNTATLLEPGVEGGFQMIHYVPLPNQPGYVDDPANPGHSYVAYNFISDVPEPTTMALVATCLLLVTVKRRRV
ncbi:MAG: PEP-CTERM sorting domain-containing protein [Verrucomicrobiota bacterium]